jgi:phytoene desaturase
MLIRIIGSGIGGIATAIRMAAKGHEVHVHEANAYPGGKLTEFALGDYRFDAGPSLFTMPHFVDELFELSGEDPKGYFTYKKWPTACHYFFEDGTFLPFSSNQEELFRSVEKVLNVDSGPLKKHLLHSEYIYKKTSVPFLERSLHSVKNHLTKETVKAIMAIPNLGLFTTMNKLNSQQLNHPKLVQIFNRYATYNGSNPYKAPGILHVIPFLEHGFGTFFPSSGMHDITTSLVDLAKRKGVQFHLNSKVEKIEVKKGAVVGIIANGNHFDANTVICNADIKPAYEHLLPDVKKPKRILRQERSSSALIFYWGIKKKFPQLDLHNIFFADDYKEEFSKIFNEKTIAEDPTVYVHISSKANERDAPDYAENWFVMINVPSNEGQDWNALREKARRSILDKLSRMLHESVEELIEVEDFLDPIRIEQRTSSAGGALYGTSSNSQMAAFFRHPNFSKIDGLYFVGGSVHPGGGIPLCLLSAKIVDDLIH